MRCKSSQTIEHNHFLATITEQHYPKTTTTQKNGNEGGRNIQKHTQRECLGKRREEMEHARFRMWYMFLGPSEFYLS